MKKAYSTSWVSSQQTRKQRKYRYNAPLHVRSKFLHVHLDASLRKKYGKRSLRIRKGDSVKILRGQYKGKIGKVDRVSVAYSKVYIQGIDKVKKDGSKSFVPIEPSNIMITELDLSDKKRAGKVTKNE